MTKLIELGSTQAKVMNLILCEEYNLYPKKTKKFTMIKVNEDDVHTNYYLCFDGKIDTEFYGELMYKLGFKMK